LRSRWIGIIVIFLLLSLLATFGLLVSEAPRAVIHIFAVITACLALTFLISLALGVHHPRIVWKTSIKKALEKEKEEGWRITGYYRDGGKKKGVRYATVEVMHDRLSELRLSSESMMTHAFLSDVKIGAEDADKKLRIRGPELHALALLDHRTRQQLMTFSYEQWELDKGRLRVTCPGDHVSAETLIREAMVLAKSLVVDENRFDEALADNVASDPELEFRLRSFTALANSYSGAALKRGVAAAGSSDEHDLQILAAVWKEDIAPLAALKESAIELHELTAYAVTSCLGEGQAGAGEATLCALLRHPKQSVVDGAVTALGKVGTIASVEVLRTAGEGQAVSAIQSRAGGGHGQLALYEDEDKDGKLSFAQSDGIQGGLSIADSHDEPPSMGPDNLTSD
jgi:hypothetical protein